MPVPLFVVDAFTHAPFGGNPAAVCVLDGPADEAWMQAVAAEMNLSETAFVHPDGNGWSLRWFTPTKEVDLCGHATLATAHTLWTEGLLGDGPAVFATRSGTLTCTRDGNRIAMDFPAAPATPSSLPDGAAEALGIDPLEVLEAPNGNLLIRLSDEAAVRAVSPDFTALLATSARHGFIITAPGDDADYVCRYFVPAWGINEDPVTGSIQCTLGPYWAERLGQNGLTAVQASRRGGRLDVAVQDDRVVVAGRAVTVTRGTLDA